jgi:two-component sensor histidine kinase
VPPLGLRFKGEAQPANLALIFFAGMAVVAAAQAFRARSRREVRERLSEVAERDLMLRELDHRMKNNFQTVASLLKLQLRRTADEPARDALQEALNRVVSISEAHRNLYAAGHDLARVDMGVYLSDLCANLADALLLGEMVRLECSVEPGALDRDRAVAVGLIVNELVTNSAKHAFLEGKPGQIRVAFGRQPEGFRLTVEDNGRGLPPDYATRGPGLGRGLVEAFTRQAGGSLKVGKGPGAKFEVDLAA